MRLWVCRCVLLVLRPRSSRWPVNLARVHGQPPQSTPMHTKHSTHHVCLYYQWDLSGLAPKFSMNCKKKKKADFFSSVEVLAPPKAFLIVTKLSTVLSYACVPVLSSACHFLEPGMSPDWPEHKNGLGAMPAQVLLWWPSATKLARSSQRAMGRPGPGIHLAMAGGWPEGIGSQPMGPPGGVVWGWKAGYALWELLDFASQTQTQQRP